VERKRMSRWYMKLFRRVLNATILNSLVIYRQNVEQKVDHLKFRIDLVEGLLVKHSMLHGMSGHHDGNNTINRLTECHFPSISPTEKKCKPTRQCDVYSKHNKRRETVHYCEDCNVALCVDGCFEAYHTKKNL
jgi:hypothetical protein